MSEQNIEFDATEAFDAEYADNLAKFEPAYLKIWIKAWNEATADANKRIEALEGEVAELKDAKQDLEKEVIHLQGMIEPLQANNNDFREALETIATESHYELWQVQVATKALSATPAESLQALKEVK